MNNPFPPQLIRASAGTGKTFRLSNQYIQLLVAGEEPEKILATTFTRKAAHEISERIFLRLADAAATKEAAAELGSFIGSPSFSPQDATKLLLRLIRDQHRVRIATLDSFFMGIAKSFAYEIGIEAGWSILDDHRDEALQIQSISDMCRQLSPQELLELLKLLAKGGAKRSVQNSLSTIVRVLYEVYRESGADAWDWLEPQEPLSESELKTVSERLSKLEIPKTAKGTPNKNWEKALLQAQNALTSKDWQTLMTRGVSAALLAGKDTYSRGEIPPEVKVAFAPLLKHMTAVVIDDLRQQTTALHQILEHFDRSYQKLKSLQRAYRLSDLKHILKCERFFGSLEEVYYRLDSRIHHLLLDEFQDTSTTEWLILEPFVEEILAGNDDSSFFCVGDMKQAIYGWRGGNSEIFDTLESRWSQLEPEQMNASFRSSPQVIQTVNDAFAGVVEGGDLPEEVCERWRTIYTPHESHRTELEGYTELRQISDDEESNYPATYLAAVSKIRELRSVNQESSIGVLVRKNSEVALLIYLLSQEGVMASEEGGNPLTDSRAVVLLLSLFRLLDHPGDSIAEFHVINSPLSSLGFGTLCGEKKTELCITKLQERLHQIGFGSFLREASRDLLTQVNDREVRRIGQLIELGYVYDNSPGERIDEFVDFVRRKKVEDPERKSVRVMTVHQSKGLEFDIVVFPELGKNMNLTPRLPVMVEREHSLAPPKRIVPVSSEEIRSLDPRLQQMRESDKTDQLNEELSILYVALTRAKRALYIYVPDEEGRSRLSYSALLVAALSKGIEEKEILYTQGNPDWFTPSGAESVQEKVEEFSEVFELKKTETRTRMLPKKSPSKLEGGGDVDLHQLLEPKRSQAAKRGTAIHAYFEAITWLPDRANKVSEEDTIARELGLSVREHETYRAEFEKMLSVAEVSALFDQNRYQQYGDTHEVKSEFPFIYRDGESLMNGFIDRCIFSYQDGKLTHAEIIDFKTDRSEDIEQKIAYYEPQLRAYGQAIARVSGLPIENISLTLAFVSHGKVHQLPVS